MILLTLLLWNRVFRTRVPKELPLNLNEFNFSIYFWITLTFFCLVIYTILSFFRKKRTQLNLASIFSESLINLDTFIKSSSYLRRINDAYLYQFLFYLSKIQNLNLYLVIVPKIIVVIIFIVELFIFQQLKIFYLSIILLLLPLIFRYMIHTYEELYDSQCLLLDERLFLFCHEPLNDDIDIHEFVDLTIKANLVKPTTKFNCTITLSEIYIAHVCKKNNTDPLFYDRKNALIDFTNMVHNLCNHYKFIYKIKEQKKKYDPWINLIVYSLYFIGWFYILYVSFHTLPVDAFINLFFLDNIEPFSSMEIYPIIEAVSDLLEDIKKRREYG
jgi:hypothetical protein